MRYMLSLSLPGAQPWTHVLKTDDDCYVRLHRVLQVRCCSFKKWVGAAVRAAEPVRCCKCAHAYAGSGSELLSGGSVLLLMHEVGPCQATAAQNCFWKFAVRAWCAAVIA